MRKSISNFVSSLTKSQAVLTEVYEFWNFHEFFVEFVSDSCMITRKAYAIFEY